MIFLFKYTTLNLLKEISLQIIFLPYCYILHFQAAIHMLFLTREELGSLLIAFYRTVAVDTCVCAHICTCLCAYTHTHINLYAHLHPLNTHRFTDKPTFTWVLCSVHVISNKYVSLAFFFFLSKEPDLPLATLCTL